MAVGFIGLKLAQLRLNMGERYTCVYNVLQKTSAYVDPGLEGGGALPCTYRGNLIRRGGV
jgi:hypothetical protein